jgi:hypothetical protein
MKILRHLTHTDEIEYRVPISCVRIGATITEVDDSVLNTQERTPEATVDLVVIGGEELTAKIDSDVLRDTSVAFSMTDDGVLVSSSVDSTGEAGKVLLGVVSVGAAIAGGFVGSPGAIGGLARIAHVRELVEGGAAEPLLPETPDDPVMAAFAKDNPAVYRMRVRYAELVEELQKRAADALDEVRDAGDTAQRREAIDRLRSCGRALWFARAEAVRLDEVFNAWRATTITTRTETHEILISLDDVRRSGTSVGADQRPIFDAGDDAPSQKAKAKAERIWAETGVVIVLEERAGTVHEATEPPEDNKIVVRSPRRVTLSLYKKDDASAAYKGPQDATVVLIESKPQLVMDQLGELQTIAFHKSMLAKRTSSLTFSDLGALTGIATTRTASAAGLADTAQAIPGTIAASLEQTKKLYDDVGALRNRSIDARLAELKREVALKQNEIALAGLHATEAQSAELARLKQQEAILKEQKTIAGYATPAPAATTATTTIS